MENKKIYNLEDIKKINFTICKINIQQFKKLYNILSVQMISKKWKNQFKNKTIESFVVSNFDTHPLKLFKITKL